MKTYRILVRLSCLSVCLGLGVLLHAIYPLPDAVTVFLLGALLGSSQIAAARILQQFGL